MTRHPDSDNKKMIRDTTPHLHVSDLDARRKWCRQGVPLNVPIFRYDQIESLRDSATDCHSSSIPTFTRFPCRRVRYPALGEPEFRDLFPMQWMVIRFVRRALTAGRRDPYTPRRQIQPHSLIFTVETRGSMSCASISLHYHPPTDLGLPLFCQPLKDGTDFL